MRSRIFCKKFKSLTFFVLSALLILPTLIGALGFSREAFAETCTDSSRQYCYVIKIYSYKYADNIGQTRSEVLSKTITLSTDSNEFKYDASEQRNTSGTTRITTTISNFTLSNAGNTLHSYSQTSGTYNLGPIRIEIYQSDGTTLIQKEDVSYSGGSHSFTANGDTGTPGTDTDGNGGSGGTEEATCHSESGAVGWFVCPILELAASASVWAYNTVIEPSLRIRSDLFNTTGSNTGTFQAWSAFRDVANVIFVILLLVVILSQLTGIGIDNYGIKKTLPNLVVAAILVNLSFVICQALVDVSNIVGAGTYNAIESISGGITVPNLGPGGEIAYATSIIFTICGAAAGIGVAAAVTGGFWTMISGALLAVLPAIIGAIVAILFLFFLLAMRQAIVVMLVAVAPLAFVCYTLPNTKRLFSRWSELLRAMLILYPICAVMIAGGRLASKIILVSGAAENNLFIILVAMVAEAGPLFLIPGLTRSAYRATGQLGATLNNLRGRWANGLSQRAGNSNTMRYLRQQNQNARANTVINRHRRRYGSTTGAITPPTGRLRRAVYGIRNMGYQQAQGVSTANISQLANMYRDSDKATVDNELNDALKKLDPQRFVAAFRDLLQKGGREEALTALYNNAAVMNDPTMRASIEREMGGSGDTFMKEYTKYKATGGAGDFKQFIDTGALTAQLNTKGETSLANADKDVYAFMAHVAQEETRAGRAHTAFSGLNANVIARASTSLSASDQAAKFNTFVTNMSYTDAQQQSIVNEISTADAASMFDSTREALSTAAPRRSPTAQVQKRFDRQFNGSIDPSTGARNPDGISSKDGTGNYANNGIRSRMSAADIAKYGL